jgi:hypothetical protein
MAAGGRTLRAVEALSLDRWEMMVGEDEGAAAVAGVAIADATAKSKRPAKGEGFMMTLILKCYECKEVSDSAAIAIK